MRGIYSQFVFSVSFLCMHILIIRFVYTMYSNVYTFGMIIRRLHCILIVIQAILWLCVLILYIGYVMDIKRDEKLGQFYFWSFALISFFNNFVVRIKVIFGHRIVEWLINCIILVTTMSIVCLCACVCVVIVYLLIVGGA
jgi:hypothetical protein